jgi:aspartate-semialdehyde dehydrogenase
MSDAGRFRLALVGSESLRGKEIRSVFGAGKFPVRSFEFYDPDVEEEFSRLTEFRDEPKVVHHLEPLPRAEKAGPDGFTAAEKRVRDEVRRVLEAPALPLSVSFVQAPVFHAYGVMVHLETERDADLKGFAAALASDPVFRMEPPEGAKSAGPAAVVGKDEIYVGAVKRDAAEPRDFWVWLAADNLTAGAALNTLAVARALCGAD